MRALRAAVLRGVLVVVPALLAAGLTGSLAGAQEPDVTDDRAETMVEILPLRGGFVDPPVSAQIADVVARAEDEGSDLVVLQYTSPGGVSVDIDGMLDTIGGSSVPVAVLIGPLGRGAQARGAAGLLWLSGHVRAISSDATVGPLRPADLSDEGYPTEERVRARIAELGADPGLADRLLDEAVDAATLERAGVATLVVEGIEPLLLELDGRTVTAGGIDRELSILRGEVDVRIHSLGLIRRALHAATTAPFIYLLLVLGVGLLLFEVFQPGFGVAGLAGIVTAGVGAFGLTVLPVTWWAVALVVLGLLLYAVDVAVAGFGLLTASATAAFAVGSANFYASEVLALSWWLVAGTTVTAFVFFVFVMTIILRAQAGPEGVAVDELVGRPGTVRSVLNPEGHVYIDGALWRARWTGDSKRAKVGTPVRVHGVDGPVVLVEPFDADAAASAAPTGGAQGTSDS